MPAEVNEELHAVKVNTGHHLHGKTIHIGPYCYQVIVSQQLCEEFDPGRFIFAYSDHPHAEIVMNDSVEDSAMRETLWHEIKHCVHPHEINGMKHNEELVISLTSPAEVAVLRDNPWVVDYLTGPR